MGQRPTAALAALFFAGCGSQVDTGSTQADLRYVVVGTPTPSSRASTMSPGVQSTAPAVPDEPIESGEPVVSGEPVESGEYIYDSSDESLSELVPEDTLVSLDQAASAQNDSNVRASVSASELAMEGECRLWLDAPGSQLLPDDLSVDVDGQLWLATTSCDGATANWFLAHDELGVWLELCPLACQALLAQPAAQLTVRTKYSTKPRLR